MKNTYLLESLQNASFNCFVGIGAKSNLNVFVITNLTMMRIGDWTVCILYIRYLGKYFYPKLEQTDFHSSGERTYYNFDIYLCLT